MPYFYPEDNTPVPNEPEFRVVNKILDGLNAIGVILAGGSNDAVTQTNFNQKMQDILTELAQKTEPDDLQKVDIVSSSSPLALEGSVEEGDSLTGVKGIAVYGKDGSGNAKFFTLDASGNPTVNLAGIGGIATETTLGTVSTKLSTIDGHIDGLEALVGTTNTTLTTIDGHIDGIESSVDGIEALIGTTNTTLSTIDGHIDGVEALIGTTNTTLTTIDGRVDGLEGQVGIVTETAPASDTASSGLNGRLQRIAQRITSLIALLPASLGQKTMANSFPVNIASDQSVLSMNMSQVAGTTTATADGAVAAGVQRVTNAYPTKANSTAKEAGRVIKNSAGTLHRLGVANDNASTLYVQLHNATSAPADTAVPIEVYAIPSKKTILVPLPEGGTRFSTGIYACISTTQFTKTIGGSDALFWADYD